MNKPKCAEIWCAVFCNFIEAKEIALKLNVYRSYQYTILEINFVELLKSLHFLSETGFT